MSYQNLEPVSKQLTIVVGLTVVGFMTFGLALSVYRNILFEETLDSISNDNATIQAQIQQSHDLLDEYQSAQYKDAYAKENLGRLNPGEKMLIIQTDTASPDFSAAAGLTPAESRDAAYQEMLREMPVYLHWQLYLFDRDKLDQLKKGLST